jgi:NADP-dependent 3-hydroxy acid dehydrogenase YdfG
MSTLKDKVVVITGASKGIGRALALQLAGNAGRLVLMARDAAALALLQQEITAKGSQCLAFAGDVGNEAFVAESFAAIQDHWSSVDVLINNAGFGIFKPTEEVTPEDWDAVFATNAKGTFLTTKAAIPGMKAAGKGHIVNIASDVAKRVFAGGALYCASKYAQDAFSMAIRKELRPFGIKVSVVYSGLVDSSFHAEPQGHSSHSNWLSNQNMADAICYIINQPAHVVIDELMIHPLEQDY